jgi:L-ascorbate metabolism protein UlaG (beta-lactamase superfamily)
MQKRIGTIRVSAISGLPNALHTDGRRSSNIVHRTALFALTLALGACRAGTQYNTTTRSTPAAAKPVPAQLGAAGTLQWIGGPTVLLERGGLRILTDPMLGGREEQAFTLPKHPSSGVVDAPIARYTSPIDVPLEGLDAILISHTHNDHFDARAKQILPKGLPLIVAASGAESVRAAGFTDVRGLDWGESITLEAHGTVLQVTAVAAHHAHAETLDHQLGRGNGYILEWRDRDGPYRAYWTGDSVLSAESQTLSEQHGRIDLLLPHMGGVGGDGGFGLRTMNADEAIQLVRRIQPGLVIPIHHTTFAHYREPIEALQQRAEQSGLARLFRFLREGQSLTLAPATTSSAQ